MGVDNVAAARASRFDWNQELSTLVEGGQCCEIMTGACPPEKFRTDEEVLAVRIVHEFAVHYNRGRPHTALGPGFPEPNAHQIERRSAQLSTEGKATMAATNDRARESKKSATN